MIDGANVSPDTRSLPLITGVDLRKLLITGVDLRKAAAGQSKAAVGGSWEPARGDKARAWVHSRPGAGRAPGPGRRGRATPTGVGCGAGAGCAAGSSCAAGASRAAGGAVPRERVVLLGAGPCRWCWDCAEVRCAAGAGLSRWGWPVPLRACCAAGAALCRYACAVPPGSRRGHGCAVLRGLCCAAGVRRQGRANVGWHGLVAFWRLALTWSIEPFRYFRPVILSGVRPVSW